MFSIVLSFGMSALLARMLGPRPFGQVVIASTIFGFVNMFVNGGFGQALIQQTELTNLEIRRTFTFQVAFGVATTAVVAALAPLLSRLFHDPTSRPVIQAMSLMITLQALGLVSASLLRREMRFKWVQFSGIAGYFLGYVLIGLPMALYGWGVWSLVAAYLSQALATSLLLYAGARHPLLPSFHMPDRSVTSFGRAVVANNLANWGHVNLDNLASSQLGPYALGLYGRASNLAYQPVTALANTVQPVLLSAVAKVQRRPELLSRLVLAMLAIVFGLVGPAYVTLAMVPDTVIVGLYGTKWIASIPLMIPLALAMPFYGGMSLLGPVLAGIGKPQLEFWPQAVTCVLGGVAFFTASHFGLVWIAWALVGVQVARLAAMAYFTFRELGLNWWLASTVLLRRATFSVAFGVAVQILDSLLRHTHLVTGLRLTCDAALAMLMLAATIWAWPHVIFGGLSINFLLNYGTHLPQRYVRQLQARQVVNTGSAAVDPVSFS